MSDERGKPKGADGSEGQAPASSRAPFGDLGAEETDALLDMLFSDEPEAPAAEPGPPDASEAAEAPPSELPPTTRGELPTLDLSEASGIGDLLEPRDAPGAEEGAELEGVLAGGSSGAEAAAAGESLGSFETARRRFPSRSGIDAGREVEGAPGGPSPFAGAPGAAGSEADTRGSVPDDEVLSSAPRLSKLDLPRHVLHPEPAMDEGEGGIRDAGSWLAERGEREVFAARATWLAEEARQCEDRATRARGLLAAAELFAMVGDDAAAEAAAAECRELSPGSAMASRQLRAMLGRAGRTEACVEILDAEARFLPTAEARCHDALLAADIARFELGDTEGARRRAEAAARANPADPRPHLLRFLDAVATDGAQAPLGKLRLPEGPELAPLAAAFAHAAALRGGPSPLARGGRPPASAAEALWRCRAALDAGDVAEACELLSSGARAEIAGGARWLIASLAAGRKETRHRALAALSALVAEHGKAEDGSATDAEAEAAARRALALLALEAGDGEALDRALFGAPLEAIAPADRASIAALADQESEAAPQLALTGADEALGALAAAIAAALGPEADEVVEAIKTSGIGLRPSARAAAHGRGSDGARASLALARALGRDLGVAGYDEPARGFIEAKPESALARTLALELELDASAGPSAGVAHAHAAGAEGGYRAVAGALLGELAGERELAESGYAQAALELRNHEGVVRARAEFLEPGAASEVLAQFAQAAKAAAGDAVATPGATRAALLLAEAALGQLELEAAESAEAGAELDPRAPGALLLEEAAAADPSLPFATHLGERRARARTDRDELIRWLGLRRAGTTDPVEQAHDLVREALLRVEEGGAAASALLRDALASRPVDAGVRDLFERFAPEYPADCADWRLERARELRATLPAESARLALEAALELEQGGDLDRASGAAREAMEAGETQLAALCVLRTALAGHGATEVIDVLRREAASAETDEAKIECWEQLADLCEFGRGDGAGALSWRRTILELDPAHLPSLRAVASALIRAGREDELAPVALATARAVPGPERLAQARLSHRLRVRSASWEEGAEAVALALAEEPRPLWALRHGAVLARLRGDPAGLAEISLALAGRTARPLEVTTLLLRAAEAHRDAGAPEAARPLLEKAAELCAAHLPVHLARAALLEALGDAAEAAESFEAASRASATEEGRIADDYRAAVLWQAAGEQARARAAFERVAEADPSYEETFERLRSIYVAEGARAELAELLRRKLEIVADPEERVEMEVLRGRALADVGDAAAAKAALASALEASPDHVEALGAFADLCASGEDWSGAEQAWIRLARLVPDPARQSLVYLRLGELYDEHLPNPERAELAYQEILKRRPEDTSARERLVRLYRRTGDFERATREQNALVASASSPEEKARRTVELAELFEEAGDAKKAEATLAGARKAFPKDDGVLAALVRFHRRAGQEAAASALLERAIADARRSLGTGRFEPGLFASIASVCRLRDQEDAARVAETSLRALEGAAAAPVGEEVELEPLPEGAGKRAGDASLDDLLAPDLLTPAFRDLLRRTGPLLDAAFPFDLGSVRATPLPPSRAAMTDEIRVLAVAYGLPNLSVLTSNVLGVLGTVCVPASASPPTIVLGQALVESPRADVRSFLVHRALKVLQLNAGAFARTAPIDLWPLLAAYLRAFSPAWTPSSVDAARLVDASARIGRAGPPRDPQLGLLAAEVIGTIGSRGSTLGTAVTGMGSRAALLALADPALALSAIAASLGHANAPPPSGKERVTWIGRNTEARELMVFSVSDAYFEARRRLGLG